MKNEPTDKALYARVKAAAKKKFKRIDYNHKRTK